MLLPYKRVVFTPHHNMKVFVDKSHHHVKNEEKKTKTSKFIGLLIKTCILPIKITGNQVLFECYSMKMLIHVIGIFGFASSTFYGLIIFPAEFTQIYKSILNLHSSWVEQMSVLITGYGSFMIVFLPSVLGYSLKNMDSDFMQYQNFEWPKIARLNIAGIIEA